MTQLSNTAARRIIARLAVPAPHGRVRIPVGMPIMQDSYFTRWPDLPDGPADPDIEFDASVRGDTITFQAPGYGEIGGNYGSGAILGRMSHWVAAHGGRS